MLLFCFAFTSVSDAYNISTKGDQYRNCYTHKASVCVICLNHRFPGPDGDTPAISKVAHRSPISLAPSLLLTQKPAGWGRGGWGLQAPGATGTDKPRGCVHSSAQSQPALSGCSKKGGYCNFSGHNSVSGGCVQLGIAVTGYYGDIGS